MKVFVLTREINQYDQDGEYFVAVFAQKPTAAQLMEHGVSQNRLRLTMNGGGRSEAMENEWFHLRERELK